jgi:hypothetical protein
MRILIALLPFCIFFPRGYAGTPPSDTLSVTCTYSASFDAPTFSRVGVAQILGLLPDRLTLIERSANGSFSILLEEDGESRWVSLSNDSAKTSLLTLPFLKEDTLSAEVIGFLSEVRTMFKKGGERTVSRKFPLGTKKLVARAHYSLDPLTDEEQALFGAYAPVRFEVRTYDERGRPYIGGTVIVGRDRDAVLYLRIAVYLPALATHVTLTMRSYAVERTK